MPLQSARKDDTVTYRFAHRTENALVRTFSGDLATPTNLAATAQASGGTLSSGQYRYRVAAVAADESEVSVATNQSVATISGAAGTGAVGLVWSTSAGAVTYNVYGRTTTSEGLLASVSVAQYTDTGSATVGVVGPYTTTGQVEVQLGSTRSIVAPVTSGASEGQYEFRYPNPPV